MKDSRGSAVLPDREKMKVGLEAAIAGKRRGGRLSKDDRRYIARIMRLLEPLFVNAENGTYPLQERWRLKKKSIARSVYEITREHVSEVEYVSFSAPVPRQDWMTDQAYAYYREVSFAYAVRSSVDPWFDAVLKRTHAARYSYGHADRKSGEDLFREAFGNRLHAAVNGGLFSGAAYPMEAILTDFTAFALTGNESVVEPMYPLMRLVPKAIPLGFKKDHEGTCIVLVA